MHLLTLDQATAMMVIILDNSVSAFTKSRQYHLWRISKPESNVSASLGLPLLIEQAYI